MGIPVPVVARSEVEWCIQAARKALGEDAFAAAWQEGKALSLEATVSLALEALGSP